MNISSSKTQSSSTEGPTSNDPSQLTPAVFKRVHPEHFLAHFLSKRVRPDGRKFDEWRETSVNVGSISTAMGSALVRQGDTAILCGVRAEIASPELSRPDEGFIVQNFDLPALSSPKFRPGPPGEEAQLISNRMRNLLLSCPLVSPSSLIIEPAKSSWALYIDLLCINYDGNVYDAGVRAVEEAVRHCRLPPVIYSSESNSTQVDRLRQNSEFSDRGGAALPLYCPDGQERKEKYLISSTFGIFHHGIPLPPSSSNPTPSSNLSSPSAILSDPSSFEADLCSTHITIVFDVSFSSTPSRDDISLYDESSESEFLAGKGASLKLRQVIQTGRATPKGGLEECMTRARVKATREGWARAKAKK